jgi:hypothetical protein
MRVVVPMLLICAATAACKVELGPDPGAPTDARPGDPDAVDGDAAIDAPVQLGPWTTPQIIQGANTANVSDDDGALSSNTTELVFAYVDPTTNAKDLYIMTRATPAQPFSGRTRLPFNSAVSDETPRFSTDDLTLYFASSRGTSLDIYQVKRPTVGGAWGTPTLVTGPNSTGAEKWFTPCGNTYVVVVNNDLAEGTLGNAPALIGTVNSATTETSPFLSKDCLTMYFASDRGGTVQLYVSTRTAVGAAWTAPSRFIDFQGLGGAQEDPFISADQRTFVLTSTIGGSKDLYISTR